MNVDFATIQGNIVRGYGKPFVRHLVLRVKHPASARKWIGATVGSDRTLAPAITNAEPWAERPDTCFNIALTHVGFRALEVASSTLQMFPEAFAVGMAARSAKLGDVGESAPDRWLPSLRRTDHVHVIASIAAKHAADLDRVQREVFFDLGSTAFDLVGLPLDGAAFDGGVVHFGYRDSISQPRFEGVHDQTLSKDEEPLVPLGTILLGLESPFEGVRWRVPEPLELGLNGTFNAFRVLAQDAAGFEAYLDQAATEVLAHNAAFELLPAGAEGQVVPGGTRFDAMREVIAAKICGRWRNGTSLAASPGMPTPQSDVADNDFGYANDPDGLRCPIGAHVRRANPRDGKIVQRIANNTRRIVRRGTPYGPVYSPANPDAERGLLGNFLCSDLGSQFESIQYDWINLGLQHPDIAGSNDPLLGINNSESSRFEIPTRMGPIVLRGFPRFVQVRGGAYTFFPSLTALRYLAGD